MSESKSSHPYTREETEQLRGTFPQRGELCPKCKNHIPEFVDLSVPNATRLRDLDAAGNNFEALRELRRLTGCSLLWAKIWGSHPHGRGDHDPTAPSPYCGKPLRTTRAKQCGNCKSDWHDPLHAKKLKPT